MPPLMGEAAWSSRGGASATDRWPGCWFGVIAFVVVELGLITRPVGLNVFIIHSLAPDVPLSETFKGIIPLFLSEIIRVGLIVAFPAITLFLPRLLS